MPKKSEKETSTEQDNIVTVSIGSQTTKEKLAGKIVSINLKKTTYFGIPEGIWLSPENYWVTIPDGLSADSYKIIESALRVGNLVIGKTYIPPVDKASNVKESYWMLIKDKGFEAKEAKSKFTDLIRRGQDSGWTAIEIAKFCLEKENDGKKRKPVISLLEQLITQYRGPIQLYDPPDDAEGIKKVTINADGTVEAETNSGKKVANKVAAKAPANHKPGNKTSSQAIKDLLD